MKFYKHSPSCLKTVCYLTLPIFIVLASILFIFGDKIYEKIIYTSLRPTPGSKGYHFWVVSDPSPIMEVYMFNWTNADQVNNKSVIPNFEQVGPYRFSRLREKFDIVFNDNDTVSYKLRERYEFVPEGSRSLYDRITTANPIAGTIGFKARYENQIQKAMISLALKTMTSLTMTHTVKELLFEGYRDKILDTLRPFSNFIDEELVERFGFLRDKNGSQYGAPYNVYIGANDLFGELLQYDYKYNNPYYSGECSLYHGSTSEFYPILNHNDYAELFVPDISATTRLDYEKDLVEHDMYARKFTSTYMFDNGEFIKMNRCYCPVDGCMPNGVFNVSLSSKKAPFFISSPHFLNADPIYGSKINGMKPDKDKHEFYFIMEPNTGITFKYGVRAQMNMHLKPYEGIGFFSDVPDILVPILYLDEVSVLHEEILFSLYLIQNLPIYMMITYIFLFSISFIMFVYLLSGFFLDRLKIKR